MEKALIQGHSNDNKVMIHLPLGVCSHWNLNPVFKPRPHQVCQVLPNLAQAPMWKKNVFGGNNVK